MPRAFHGRTITAGFARAPALVAQQPFMFAHGMDPRTGCITDRRHELHSQSIRGRVFLFPHGKGSTTGSAWLLETLRLGNGPAAILNREMEPIIATGLILGELLYGTTIPAMDRLIPDPFPLIRSGDLVEVDGARRRVRVWRQLTR